MKPSERLKKIEDQMKDELFEGQAWYAAVSRDDFLCLWSRVKKLTEALYQLESESWGPIDLYAKTEIKKVLEDENGS